MRGLRVYDSATLYPQFLLQKRSTSARSESQGKPFARPRPPSAECRIVNMRGSCWNACILSTDEISVTCVTNAAPGRLARPSGPVATSGWRWRKHMLFLAPTSGAQQKTQGQKSGQPDTMFRPAWCIDSKPEVRQQDSMLRRSWRASWISVSVLPAHRLRFIFSM